MIANNNLTTLAVISAVTALTFTGLIIISGGRFNSNWNENSGSITIEAGENNQK